MKVFWSIIAVLFIAAVAVAFIPDKNDGPSLLAASNTQAVDDDVVAQATPNADADVVANDRGNSDTTTETPAASAPNDTDTTGDPQLSNDAAMTGDDAGDDNPLTDVNTTTDDTDDRTTATGDDATDFNDSTASASNDEQLAATENATEFTGEESADPAPSNLLNATVEEQPDGSLLIADKYTVRGTGEFDDPYTLPWDLLVSLSSVYKPREGQKELPEFIMRMHDKQVKITGYIAFPMVAGEIEELLVMLNQWDGCCVGVPPTVYDSVEVRLIEPIHTTGASTTMPYGTVTGRMTIDPYFVNDWLVGLYLMEEAEIDIDF